MAENPSPPPPGDEAENSIESEFDLEDIEFDEAPAPAQPQRAPEPASAGSEPNSPHIDSPSEINFSEDETQIVFDDEDNDFPAPPPPRRGQAAPQPETAPIPLKVKSEEEIPLDSADSDDSAAGEASGDSSAAPPPPGATRKKMAGFFKSRLPKKPLELASFGILALFLMMGAYSLAKSLNQVVADSDKNLPARQVPKRVKGEHLAFKINETYWRDRAKGDPGDPIYKILPEFKVQLESGGQSVYLQALFKDENGKIRGDSMTYKIQNGKFDKTGTPEAVYLGSGGFTNRVYFAEYVEYEDVNRWTITLKESSDNETWSEIAFFEIPPLRQAP